MPREYPKQIFCVWEQGRCLNATMDLRCSLDEGDQSPLEMHDDSSRYTLSILDKALGTFVYVNSELLPSDIPLLTSNTQMAKQVKIQNQYFGGDIEESLKNIDSVYTARIPFGQLYGLTPAQVLFKYKKGEKLLAQTKNVLTEKGFSCNEKYITAIDKAVELFKSGNLLEEKKIPDLEKSEIPIFDSGFRLSIKGRTDIELCKKYKVSIKYLINETKCPWFIEITNFSAPYKKMGDLKSGMDLKNIKENKTLCVLLSDKDWFYCLHRLEKTTDMFENYYFEEMFKTALQYEKENIEKWKKNRN